MDGGELSGSLDARGGEQRWSDGRWSVITCVESDAALESKAGSCETCGEATRNLRCVSLTRWWPEQARSITELPEMKIMR